MNEHEHLGQLAALLESLGCPRVKTSEMALQLDKRARQLAEQKQRPYEEAMAHLLNLMRQGWAAAGQKSAGTKPGPANP